MRTLLIVDDEAEILMLARMALKREYQVLSAASGEAALAILAQTPIDALITDHRMPGLSGLELIRQARVLRPGLPCLLSTGFAPDAEMLEAVHALGIEGVIHKPWAPSELRQAIAALPGMTH